MAEMTMSLSGAPKTGSNNWNSIDWKTVKTTVRRLQMRIAKAYREKKYGRAKALQWLLTHSYNAKLLAVKRVTQNKGAKTPGVDMVTWKTPNQKLQAVASLKRHGYKTLPLRRIYIPKKQPGKLRPLSIPAMHCRAMQALYLLALEPIAEMMADPNAYGFRPKRSTADAIAQCFSVFSRHGSAEYILEADIKSCFDNIDHSWLLNNTPMDKIILKKWLQAGYVTSEGLYPTTSGTPQGGLISPTLLVVTLSGLEQVVKATIRNNKRHKVHVSIYADDFVISGASKEVLENKVKPAVDAFLSERGLSLSEDKTKITHIVEGFDFLGMNIRRYNGGKLIIKPAKQSVKRFLAEIRKVIKMNRAAKTEVLIHLLNQKIRGWVNYFRHVCSSRTFGYINSCIIMALWRWAIRRHPNKGRLWVRKKYFRTDKSRNWVFFSKIKTKDNKIYFYDLIDPNLTNIRRHIKIPSNATPYDPAFNEYFANRRWVKTYAANGAKHIEDRLGNFI